MTKARAPLTFAQAITRIAGHLGYDVAAKIAGRSERCIYDWAQPDGGATPTLKQALALDAAYVAAGGDGTPLLDAFAFQLEVQVSAQLADHRELARDISIAAREAGEAISTALDVVRPDASEHETHRAIAECDDAQTRFAGLKKRLATFLPSGAGPVGATGRGL